jgi:hypothetical protein
MAEKIKMDAMLCALPDELMRMIGISLRDKGIETMEAHNREEMLALLESHTFIALVTVSSWLPEDEVMARGSYVPSLEDISAIILCEPQHFKKDIPDSLKGPDPIVYHAWVYMPFDIEEVILRAMNIWRWPPRR